MLRRSVVLVVAAFAVLLEARSRSRESHHFGSIGGFAPISETTGYPCRGSRIRSAGLARNTPLEHGTTTITHEPAAR